MAKDPKIIIEGGDIGEYEYLNELFKNTLKEKAEKDTAQAPEVYKVAVRDSVDNLCGAMDSFRETEKETVVSPLTWKTYLDDNKEAIDKSLTDLGKLVGATATNAREAVAHQAETIFELTEKAIRSINDAVSFFQRSKELLEEKDRDAKESMKRISDIITELGDIPKEDLPDEARDAFVRMQRESMEMLKRFQSLYETAHKPAGKIVPGKISELFETARASLKTIRDDLQVCSCMKKAATAVKEQGKSVFGFISRTAEKIVTRANGYMKALKDAKDKVYEKGRDINDKLRHLKPVLVVGLADSRDLQMGRYLNNLGFPDPSNTLAQRLVREMMKDGLEKKDILENLTQLGNSIKEAAKDRKTLEMIEGKGVER